MLRNHKSYLYRYITDFKVHAQNSTPDVRKFLAIIVLDMNSTEIHARWEEFLAWQVEIFKHVRKFGGKSVSVARKSSGF